MATLAAVLIIGACATAIDIRTRRIPNVLTGVAALLGMVFAVSGISGLTVAMAAMGAVLGFCLMAPGHFFGATGAGDVKLLAAFGALLGPQQTVMAFLFTAIAGGVLAIAFAAMRGRVATTLRSTGRLFAAPAAAQQAIEARGANNSFPYGPAIAIGALLSAIGGL